MAATAMPRLIPLLTGAILAGTAYASAAADDTAAEIQALKRRLEALEARQKIEAAAKPEPAAGNASKIGETRFSWGGYVKLDTLYSRFSEGEVLQGTGRDFYVPNSIPAGAGGEQRDFIDFHAKSTRVFFKTETPFDGHKVGTHVEFDFIVNQSSSASERVTNAYTPGFRRGFLTFDNWLFGQEWSTFQNLVALPEALDFVEFPSEGTVFVRQPMLRYTLGSLMLSIENPETALLPFGGGTISDSNDARIPDLVARYNFCFQGGSEVSIAGLLRQLEVQNAASDTVARRDDRELGWGLSLAGKFALGSDDLKFMASAGDGIGRYLALGTSADAVITGDNELETIGLYAAYLAYRHHWTPKWRSTLMVSAFAADNDEALTGTGVTHEVRSVAANLLYSPVPKLTFGGEIRHAERELESGADGALDRLQFSARLNF